MASKGLYARDTSVSPEQSLNDIRDELKRYSAEKFMFFEETTRIGVAFEMSKRRVRFIVPLPTLEESSKNALGTRMGKQQAKQAHAKSIRQKWRALYLVIKAKLESVASGIETFEEAFMAQLMLPDGRTMSEWATPQIAAAYNSGKMPPLLPSGL